MLLTLARAGLGLFSVVIAMLYPIRTLEEFTFTDSWNEFEHACIPSGCLDPKQVADMRQLFITGAWTALEFCSRFNREFAQRRETNLECCRAEVTNEVRKGAGASTDRVR